MKRVILAALGVAAVAIWGFGGKGNLGRHDEWNILPNGTIWPLGTWGLPIAVLLLFGGAALLSAYDRFNRAKSRQEEKNSVVIALICLAILGFLLPWTLLGPGNLKRINEPSQLARITLEGRFNLIASQWSDLATEYFGMAYSIDDAREFSRTYASTRQNPNARVLAHIATHPPGATLWYYGVRRFAEGVPGLNDNLNSLAVRLTGQEEAPLFSLLNNVRATASRGAGVPAPPPLPRGAIGGALLCVILMGLSLIVALPAVYGLATIGIDETSRNDAEARGLFACALWVLAPSFNLYSFSLDAVIACGAAWTLFFAARALSNHAPRDAVLTGIALALTSMLSFGALALSLVIIFAALFSRTPFSRWFRTAAFAVVAFVLAWVLAALWGGFNPLQVMLQATAAHKSATLNVRPYSHWVVLNLFIWAIFCGWPLIVSLAEATRVRKELIIRTGTRKEASAFPLGLAFALGTISTLVLLCLSGQVRGEVERLWLFLLAPLTACLVVRSGKEATAMAVLQGVQTLVMAATIAPLIRPF
ncbi:hypothetical protein IAD21_04186 [Abditibacteriota bacterium]|nr:hypothetical protein IAD21_04186 [Abditibacteriota bacterium]